MIDEKTSDTNVIEHTVARSAYLYTKDLETMFHVGRSKARLMMDSLPSVRVGSKDCILAADLKEYMIRHGGITVKWPKRHRMLTVH